MLDFASSLFLCWNPRVLRCFQCKSDAHWTHSLIQYIYLFGALCSKWDSRCSRLYCGWHKANHQRGPVIKIKTFTIFFPSVLHVLQAESNLCASRLSGPPRYFLLPHMLWPFSSSTPPSPPPPPLPSPCSCPLPGFRLMTSDSPLRGASCLQSAVRLLVIIFQSVTLVSALWRCEEERGRRPWLAGWLKQSGRDARAVGTTCVCLCLRVWIEVAAMEKAVTALCSPSFDCRVSVLKRHCERWMCFCLRCFCLFLHTILVEASSFVSVTVIINGL